VRSPDSAPPRPDLGWLRHRRVASHPIAYVHPPRPSAAPPSLDRTPAPTSPVPAPAPPSLDLDLHLDRAPARAPEPAGTPRRSRPAALPYPRLARGTTAVLAGRRRTVTLTRLQSGTGALQVSLSRAAAAGDLALGVVLATTDGATHVLQRLGDALATPTTPAAPLPLARLTGGPGSEGCVLDLRQVGRLQRALVYGYSPSIAALTWDGLLGLTTYDGSRVEVPFDLPPLSGTVALLTAYQVRGELVLRAELEPFAGPPETAAQAYGYSYGWLDGRLPAR
jgi:hypothetical protein